MPKQRDVWLRIKGVCQRMDVTRMTVWSWRNKGVKNRMTGERIYLKYWQRAGVLEIRESDLKDFLRRTELGN